MKLMNGLRVVVIKMSCGNGKDAGSYVVQRIDYFSSKLILQLSSGEPYNSAYEEAEMLAVLIDAEFVLKEGLGEKILRKSLKGEYFSESIAKVKKEEK